MFERGVVNNRLALAQRVLAEAERNAGVRPVKEPVVYHNVYDVPQYLLPVFPHGIAKGSIVEIAGSMSIGVMLAGIVARQGAWVACVGMPSWGWSLANASGISLHRCVTIPYVSQHSAQVMSAVIDGFDVVIAPSTLIPHRQQRILERRVRARSGVLFSLGSWAGSTGQVHGVMRDASGEILKNERHVAEIGPISHIDYEVSSWWGSALVRFSHAGWGGM